MKRSKLSLAARVTPNLGREPGTQAFWDCRLKANEWLLLGTVALLTAALHLGPVLHSGLAVPLIYGLAAVSYLSPITGFFFIACSQFLPFPEGSPHNPAQAGVLVWLPMILLRYQGLRLAGLGRLWPVVPWLLWFMVLTSQPIFLPDSDYVKALAYAAIACQLANEAKGQFLKCLIGLSLGALFVMTAYWALQLGLPVEINDWGGEREEFERMGSVRADAVMVWPALLMGISGLFGVQIALASRFSPLASPRWLTNGTLLLVAAAIPPLVSTMSHGAFAGFALVAVALGWALVMAGKSGAFGNARFKTLLNGIMLSLVVVVLLFAFDAFKLRTKAVSLNKYYKDTTVESGVAASRTGVWEDSMSTIAKYPLFGIIVTGDKETITSGYAEEGFYLSHNVFLDYARWTGIPGMLLVVFFFFWPAYLMWQSSERLKFIPFLLAHFAMLIFWMSLSFVFYKTFWALWMLMVMAVAQSGNVANRVRRSRNRPGQSSGKPELVQTEAARS